MITKTKQCIYHFSNIFKKNTSDIVNDSNSKKLEKNKKYLLDYFFKYKSQVNQITNK